MEATQLVLTNLLKEIVELSILLFEYIGLIVLLIAGIKGLYLYIRRSPYVRIELAQSLAIALEFKLGGEILRTVVVHDISELYIVGGIIVLRTVITFLLHWEIQGEAPKREPRKPHIGNHFFKNHHSSDMSAQPEKTD